jgi:AmiR/NasT family two-component response regulator
MRVWLIDDRQSPGELEIFLRQLEAQPETGISLVGASPYQPDFATAMGKLAPELLDLVVIRDSAWPNDAACEEIGSLGLGVLLVTSPQGVVRFTKLACEYPVAYVSVPPSADTLLLGLLGAMACRQREGLWKAQLAALQQRLNDRIIIERAKGILVQRLGICEDDAYRRLRMLSRRQRRQMRDIAQSLLDTQSLFAPELNGQALAEDLGNS